MLNDVNFGFEYVILKGGVNKRRIVLFLYKILLVREIKFWE